MARPRRDVFAQARGVEPAAQPAMSVQSFRRLEMPPVTGTALLGKALELQKTVKAVRQRRDLAQQMLDEVAAELDQAESELHSVWKSLENWVVEQ